ncbi:hypothetical protein ACJ41O_014228 [Fusarium nematophilum]
MTSISNPASLPELVRDSKLEATTFQADLTIHTQPLGRRRRHEKWRPGGLLGNGGYGVVLLQHRVEGDEAADQLRAVKMLRTYGRGPEYYVRELEALAKFSQDKYSEFFVKFLGWYESPEYLNIAMEYCPHGDLKKYLSRNGGRLPENQVKDIASQVLAGVVMMHRAGFANRDIKPANILIKSKPPDDWWIKVCDFGLSKRTEDIASMATTVKGTPDFMPPELLGFHTGDPKGANVFMIDMWCLGETVFQALTGQPVFAMPAAVGRYHQGTLGFPLHVLHRANVSSTAAAFIQSLMRPHPWQRMTSEQAIRHPWMEDMALDAAVRAPDTASSSTSSLSNGFPSEWSLPSVRSPGDQLTQASGQWTTTMAYRPPSQQQPSNLYGGNIRPAPWAQQPYVSPQSPLGHPISTPGLSNYLQELQKRHDFPQPPYMEALRNSQSAFPTARHVAALAAKGPSVPLNLNSSTRAALRPAVPPKDGPLVRRKTKAVDASKCDILSYMKTLDPPKWRRKSLWDENDRLILPWDTPLTWRMYDSDVPYPPHPILLGSV